MYAKAGIPEYWVVDLKGSQVIVYRHPQNNVYGSEQIFDSTANVSVDIFPDIEIDLSQLLILD